MILKVIAFSIIMFVILCFGIGQIVTITINKKKYLPMRFLKYLGIKVKIEISE